MGYASTERVADLSKEIGKDIAEISNNMIARETISSFAGYFIEKLWEMADIPMPAGLPMPDGTTSA